MVSLLLLLVIRFLQSCVFGSIVAGWLGADPEHPVIRRMRAVAKPLLDLARPVARRLPGSEEWWAMALVLAGLDVLRLLLT